MTRGRPPNIALDEAEIIAERRGEVRVIPGTRSDAFELILFEEYLYNLCQGEAVTDAVFLAARYPAAVSTRDCAPPPDAPDLSHCPGVLGPASQGELAVLPGPARFRHRDPGRRYLYPSGSASREYPGTCRRGDLTGRGYRFHVGEQGIILFFNYLMGVCIPPFNPASLRALFNLRKYLPDARPAKNGEFRHKIFYTCFTRDFWQKERFTGG